MKKLTEKETKIFWKKVNEAMDKYPVVEHSKNNKGESLFIEWRVPSCYGDLGVTIFADPCYYYCIYLRFQDKHDFADKIDMYAVNPYSGKWNITMDTMEEALALLEYRLNYIKETE